MIHVCISPQRVLIAGHANYAAFGQDIVCAGVSALALVLEESFADDRFGKADVTEKSGLLAIDIHELSEEGRVVIEVVRGAAERIAQNYPEHVCVD